MIGGIVSVGLNIEASRLDTSLSPAAGDSNFIPPDTDGAVGPNHIVEMINGNFEVFDKTTGASLETRSLQNFWTVKVGIAGTNGTIFDPKIIFDASSGRWFATSEDAAIDADDNGVNEVTNHFFIARTDTDDPTGDWDSVTVNADTVGVIEFHDYPQVGLDADGLYICTQDFDDGGHESCYSIPKSDLLLAVPTAANISRFEASPAGLPDTSGSWQPARNNGLSLGHEVLLGSTGSALQRTDIFGANAAGATLGSASAISGDPGHASPPAARQPDDADTGDGIETIENVAPRFVANPVIVNGSLWAVHAVMGSAANSALRWYEINEATNTIVQTGLINDPSVDFHEPSIAVNQFGHVVIGYTCSGPNLGASVCVSVGTTSGGVTTFVPPAIVFAGSGTYYQDFCSDPDDCSQRNRWGDYSATMVDPVDPATFWTFQEYTAQDAGNIDVGPDPDNTAGGLWGLRVVELTFNELTGGDLAVVKDCSPDVNLFAGQTGTCQMNITNFGPNSVLNVILDDHFLSNGTFSLGVPTTTKGSCTTSPNPQVTTGTLNCSLGRLDPNETVLVTINVTADTPQTVNDDAKVTTESSDTNTSNNEDQDALNFVGAADLSIVKTDAPDPVIAGMNLTYTMNISNSGPSTAVNVVVSDLLPASLSVVSVSATGGNCNAGIPGSVPTVCTFASLANGGGGTMTIVAKVDPGVPSGTIIGNNASVSSDTADNNNANNLATTSTAVITSADLRITKTDSPDPVIAGANLTYVLSIANLGPSWARSVAVADTLPGLVSFVSASIAGGSGSCSPLGGSPTVVQCSLGDLADGATRDITIQTTVASSVADNAVLHNVAAVSSPTPDPVPANNTATADTVVHTQAEIWLDKVGVLLTGNPSRTIRFTLTVFNKPGCEADDVLSCGTGGPSDAQNVVVTDTLPLDPKKVKVVFTSQNCTYNQGPHNVVCTVAGGLPAGQTASFTIDVQVAGSVGSVINSATVTTSTTDPNPANNTDSMQLVIKGGSARP